MKLASLKGGRDGQLVVVARDLTHYATAEPVARTLQAALDDWANAGPRLQEIADALERGAAATERFREREAASPLPRAYQWVDGSAYLNHVELVRRARGAEMPPSFFTDPLMYQGGSDAMVPPRDPIVLADEAWGIDCEAEVAVIVDDVPMGIDANAARSHIKLVMIVNDVSLRNLVGPELAKGFGFVHSKPPTAFSPVAVTPDELGEAWRDGKLHLPLLTAINGKPFGKPNAGQDMTFDFGQLIAHAATTRPLSAGTIVGSGTISNKGEDGSPGKPVAMGGLGYSCIAEIRTVETILEGKPKTPFLSFGDTVRIEMKDAGGHSIFGAIEQEVEEAGGMTFARKNFIALDHVQVAMPPGEEAKARAFYVGVLGMMELEKPAALAARGGAWFAGGDGACVQIHCGVEKEFRPARKAHPAVMVVGIDELSSRIENAGAKVVWDDELVGFRRFFCDDPFGNRLEFIGSLEDEA